MMIPVQLNWVLVDGNLCEISVFQALSPRDRPECFCPVCERQVTLKLGEKRVHHFAHRPEDICPSTQPETALHLNCKYHIYQQLQKATKVYTASRCQSCLISKSTLWKQDWDTVEVEYRLDSVRPDIALLKGDRVIGAIEIIVTHAVDQEKTDRLLNENIDWIEILGREELYSEPDAWTPDHALYPEKQYPLPERWVCSSCQKSQRKAEYKRNHPIEVFCARIVDLYYPTGKKYREVFYVKHALSYGKKTCIWIEDEKGETIVSEKSPITKTSELRLNNAFKQKIQEFKLKAVVVDTEMNWVRWLPGQKFVARDFDNYPFRYRWHESRRKWILDAELKWKH